MKRTIEVLNQPERDGVFSRYAVGGAVGAIFYTEPFVTFDLDIFVVHSREDLEAALSQFAAIAADLRP